MQSKVRHFAPYLGLTPKCKTRLKVFHVLTSSEERVTCRACLRRLKAQARHNNHHSKTKAAGH